ncbi:MAG: nitric oxide reductase transcriptional regulator NorR [Deltaproteobacteria bacterium]|nr:nitric oxide reductase transcriptional regulator NorR [Deltaproteobacteria bacterium]MBN2672034.1 nitric oxide reductase transcriptional regulator NorR [Deltaproteobacteria bacterium]
MDQLRTLVSIVSDLTEALSSEERFYRLLNALQKVIPFDAAGLLRLEGDCLVPVVTTGLSADAMGRRFSLREHPRLEIISRSATPVFFPADTDLPDPYDGMLSSDHGEFTRIHACMGCALKIGDELLGVLTADAAKADAFNEIDSGFLSAVSALAAAEMRTTLLIEALEKGAMRQGQIARTLMRDATLRQGSDMIGTTSVIQRLRQDIDLVAKSDFTVLITGETGTGKELVARAVHAASTRNTEPMLYVNCAALPETLADSELFGHVRGAFTGASADRAGKFEVASGGTLFLDEIGELPLSIQPKLLRAIQQGEVQRVGSDSIIRSDVRLIAATNRDLAAEVEADRFRADLFHRLNVYPLRVPPLRERIKDIPLLAGFFCDVTRRRLGLGPVRIDPDAMASLQRNPWPGNVRELENVLSRVTLQTASSVPRGKPVIIRQSSLGREFAATESKELPGITPNVSPTETSPVNLQDATRGFQRKLIAQQLQLNNNNWSAAARDLGMHRSNFHHLAKRLGF